MTKDKLVAIAEWRSMSDRPEYKAFVQAKDALVKGIRDEHGEDAPVSFTRYSYGVPEAKPVKPAKVGKPVTGEAPVLTAEQIAKIQALIQAGLI